MLHNRLVWALGEESKDSEEVAQTPWHEGGRYEVMRSILLSRRHDEPEEVVGEIAPGTLALVLAVSSFCDDDGHKATVAYLADTSRPRWLCGWALIARGSGFRPALRRVPGRGSWEVGGCYRVNGNPVVRSHVALESEPLCELKGAVEEVLLLELRLAISDSEPRLRGRVRTDGGAVGWLTLELPEEAPLLQPLNLFRREAVVRSLWPFVVPAAMDMAIATSGARRLKRRPPVNSSALAAYPWDVGGVYRTLTKLPLLELRDEAPMGWLRAGKKLKVEVIEPTPAAGRLRLRVEVESGTLAGYKGWIATSSDPKDCSLDLRDHTEFEQLMDYWRQLAETGPTAGEAGTYFTVRLQRRNGQALGLEATQLEQREGHHPFVTVVENVLEGGPVAEWNKVTPDSAVRRGDRIIAVNGLEGEAMIAEMKRCEVMYMRLLRAADAGSVFQRPPVEMAPRERAQSEILLPADVAEPEAEAEVAISHSAPVRCTQLINEAREAAHPRRRRFPTARDSDEEVQWRLEKKALAQQMVVDEVPKPGGPLKIKEDGSDWKPFYEGMPVEETRNGDCPCRSCRSRCQEEDGFFRSLLACGSHGPAASPGEACAPLGST